ncbi:FMN-dependent NADH-azoreductase [Dissostichus eleginoides]|uniref:FMN-dependent NADH-azoreductase n=1 Tax=Dissostichus eleginoides TaxID=100907 RepID=A0AAD9F312_DISEL|nr:FMN-dependent NADH-azoreductase [Dissostichus eleginoides]
MSELIGQQLGNYFGCARQEERTYVFTETLSGRAVVCLEQLGDKSSCDAMQRTAEDIRAKSNQRLRSRAG